VFSYLFEKQGEYYAKPNKKLDIPARDVETAGNWNSGINIGGMRAQSCPNPHNGPRGRPD
jgi:hypothetical protein